MIISTDLPIVVGQISGNLTPDAGTRFSKTMFGLDVLRRPFRCLTSQLESLLPERYSQDADYPGLFLTDYDDEHQEGTMSNLTLVYKGLKDGIPPDPLNSGGFSTQTATLLLRALQIIPDLPTVENDYTLNILYQAPKTTWRWIETSLPADDPRYSTVLSTLSPWDKISSASASFAFGEVSPDAVAGYFKDDPATVKTYVQDYNISMTIPDRIWECDATIIRQINPLMAPKTIFL